MSITLPRVTVLCIAVMHASVWAAAAKQKQATPAVLARLSLEQLSNVEVTSVSKKGEKLAETAAAVYVITQDDIRRSGLTSIPELLRMVPGLQVARVDGGTWAITSRGFNGRYARKMLVLMDGRSVYTSLFSGVYWEAQDTLLADIERIEVIRWPGATMWGANAVNGVVNIITKHASDTQGGLVTIGWRESGTGLWRPAIRWQDRGGALPSLFQVQ